MKRAGHPPAREGKGANLRDAAQGPGQSPREVAARWSQKLAEGTWWLALPLVLGTVLAYLPVWHAGLIWDDRSFIMDNPLIRRADGLWRFWFSTKPVDYLSLIHI